MTVFLITFGVVLLFGFVVAYGAPYLPTLKNQAETALDLLGLKPGQTLLELGCGDGRVAKLAAKRGLLVVGYELNPILVLIARAHTYRYRKQVTIKWRNYWRAKWPPTDGIFVFLLDRYMEKLDKKVIHEYKGKRVKLASYTFRIPGKKHTRHAGGVYLYRYR